MNDNPITIVDPEEISEKTSMPLALSVEAWPNPFNGAFNIQSNSSANITIMDVYGKRLAEFKLDAGIVKSIELPKETASGLIFLHTESSGYNSTQQLLYIK
jgi:hypothetical protein